MAPISLWKSVIKMIKIYTLGCVLALLILYLASAFVNYWFFYYIAGTLFVLPVLTTPVAKWISKERISPDGKAVFITGCDTGFGYMLAQRLDELGFQVFAGCLFPSGKGATELLSLTSELLHVVGLDVTSASSVKVAAKYVTENLKENVLWAIVNNAGVCITGEIHWTNMEAIQKTIDVNTLGVIRVTKAFLPTLKESSGRIITIASLAGRCVLYGNVPYSMSKSAVISFSDGLREEMYKWNIPVITIEPSFSRTPMLKEGCTAEHFTQEWDKVPEDVRNMYSSNYITKFIKRLSFVATTFAKHPREVIPAIEEAIMSSCPQHCYTPGSLVFIIIAWLRSKLPLPIYEQLLHYNVWGSDLR